jgi:hypothetical protein
MGRKTAKLTLADVFEDWSALNLAAGLPLEEADWTLQTPVIQHAGRLLDVNVLERKHERKDREYQHFMRLRRGERDFLRLLFTYQRRPLDVMRIWLASLAREASQHRFLFSVDGTSPLALVEVWTQFIRASPTSDAYHHLATSFVPHVFNGGCVDLRREFFSERYSRSTYDPFTWFHQWLADCVSVRKAFHETARIALVPALEFDHPSMAIEPREALEHAADDSVVRRSRHAEAARLMACAWRQRSMEADRAFAASGKYEAAWLAALRTMPHWIDEQGAPPADAERPLITEEPIRDEPEWVNVVDAVRTLDKWRRERDGAYGADLPETTP